MDVGGRIFRSFVVFFLLFLSGSACFNGTLTSLGDGNWDEASWDQGTWQ